jgi:hypothetical protein
LLLAGLLRLLLFGLTATGLPLLELLVELFIFLEADVLALLGLELHAAIAFGLVGAALLAALVLLLLTRVLLLAGLLLLLLAGVLLAFVPGLIGHGVLLSIRDGAGERLTLGRAVYPVR